MQYPAIQSDTLMTTLQRDILSTLACFDIFDHPLLLNEIFGFLPRGGVTEADVKSACFTALLKGRLSGPATSTFWHTDQAGLLQNAGRRSGALADYGKQRY
jgi:hypothetical protein